MAVSIFEVLYILGYVKWWVKLMLLNFGCSLSLSVFGFLSRWFRHLGVSFPNFWDLVWACSNGNSGYKNATCVSRFRGIAHFGLCQVIGNISLCLVPNQRWIRHLGVDFPIVEVWIGLLQAMLMMLNCRCTCWSALSLSFSLSLSGFLLRWRFFLFNFGGLGWASASENSEGKDVMLMLMLESYEELQWVSTT